MINASSQVQVQITILSANLKRDTRVVSSMNPFVQLIGNQQNLKGPICKGGGANPIWNESFVISGCYADQIQLEIQDFYTREKCQLIAYCVLQPFQTCTHQCEQAVHYMGKEVGTIKLSIMQGGFPVQYVNETEQSQQILEQVQAHKIQEINCESPRFQYPVLD